MEKIRDTRIKEKFVIDDEYLNGYAKLCGIMATGVYLSLCRHSNKDQSCFPSKKTIAEELAISERSVYEALKKLEEWRIIKIEQQGRGKSGNFINNLYVLLDKSEWKNKPQAIGADGRRCLPPQANDDIHRRQEVPNKELNTKELNSKVIVAPSATNEKKEFCFKSKMQEMRSGSARRTSQIIALYWDYKGIEFENEKQYQAGYKRELKAANLLTGYSNDRIEGVMMWLNDPNNCDFNWKLETIHKLIDQPSLKSFKKQPQASGSLY